MGIMEIIGIAGSVSLISGWRLYLCVFATGLAMRFDALPLPDHLSSLDVLANPWVLGFAALGMTAEFFSDKVMWLDSAWDTVHTLIRPIGGALLALAIIDPADPAYQVIVFLLGGGAAFSTHAAKAATRGAINASPEPVSNVAASTAEDVASVGLLWAIYEYPYIAGGVALALMAFAIWLLVMARRILRRLFGNSEKPAPD